jgi:hypothetical protein
MDILKYLLAKKCNNYLKINTTLGTTNEIEKYIIRFSDNYKYNKSV